MLQTGRGVALYPVKYKAIVFRPFKGEILDAIATQVNKVMKWLIFPIIRWYLVRIIHTNRPTNLLHFSSCELHLVSRLLARPNPCKKESGCMLNIILFWAPNQNDIRLYNVIIDHKSECNQDGYSDKWVSRMLLPKPVKKITNISCYKCNMASFCFGFRHSYPTHDTHSFTIFRVAILITSVTHVCDL